MLNNGIHARVTVDDVHQRTIIDVKKDINSLLKKNAMCELDGIFFDSYDEINLGVTGKVLKRNYREKCPT